MGISKNGLHGQTTGKVGDLVYYLLDGKEVVRTIGINLHPPTVPQLNNQQRNALATGLVKTALDFVRVGYSSQVGIKGNNAFNIAMPYNKKNALTGYYPDVAIDFSLARFSDGDLMPAEQPQVELVAEGLQFNWLSYPQMVWPLSSDQAMLLAYFPNLEKSVYKLFGQSRSAGADLLKLDEELLGEYMETYIAFVAADRKQVSVSTYMGNFNV